MTSVKQDVLDMTPKQSPQKEQVDKLDIIKIKYFCSSKHY